MLPSAPKGERESESPPLPDVTRREDTTGKANGTAANGVARSSRRGSATSWMFPLASTELQSEDAAATATRATVDLQHDGSHDSDYPIVTGSFSALSSSEMVVPRGKDAVADAKPGRNGTYSKLTGLLVRRHTDGKKSRKEGGGDEADSRDTVATASMSRSLSPWAATTAKRHGQSSPNPLLDGYEGSGAGPSRSALRIGTGGYELPMPPSPTKAVHLSSGTGGNNSVTGPASASRHEYLGGSPLTSLQQPHATLLRGDGGKEGGGRSAGRCADRFGESGSRSYFVPLGSTDLTTGRSRATSARSFLGHDTTGDEASTAFNSASKSTNNGSAKPRRFFSNGGISGASLSNSTSQSNELFNHTRSTHAPLQGPEDDDISMQASVCTSKSMRDAKAALLRYAQNAAGSGGGSTSRGSRMHSMARSHSNASMADAADSGSSEPPLIRVINTGRNDVGNRDRRNPLGNGGGRSGTRQGASTSVYSFGLEDEASPTSISPGSTGSPFAGRSSLFFASGRGNATDGSPTNDGRSSTSRRPSHFEGGSSPSTKQRDQPGSPLKLNGNRSTANSRRQSTVRHPSTSRDDAIFLQSSSAAYHGTPSPKHPGVTNGGYMLGHVGGSDADSEDSVEMEERHRNKVDEVLRLLYKPRKSPVPDDVALATGTSASTGTAAWRDTSARQSTPTPRLGNHAGANGGGGGATPGSNNTSLGGDGGWSGIGGLGWGGLAGFGSAAATTNNNDTETTASGGWAGLGGGDSSDDWYARMRKKAAEEEEVVVADTATDTATAPGSGIEAPRTTQTHLESTAPTIACSTDHGNPKLFSPETISITAFPTRATRNTGAAATSSGAARTPMITPPTEEMRMPGVSRSPITQRFSVIGSLRNSSTRSSVTPLLTPNTNSSPMTVVSASLPTPVLIPSKPNALSVAGSMDSHRTSTGGAHGGARVAAVGGGSPVKDRFVRRLTGGGVATLGAGAGALSSSDSVQPSPVQSRRVSSDRLSLASAAKPASATASVEFYAANTSASRMSAAPLVPSDKESPVSPVHGASQSANPIVPSARRTSRRRITSAELATLSPPATSKRASTEGSEAVLPSLSSRTRLSSTSGLPSVKAGAASNNGTSTSNTNNHAPSHRQFDAHRRLSLSSGLPTTSSAGTGTGPNVNGNARGSLTSNPHASGARVSLISSSENTANTTSSSNSRGPTKPAATPPALRLQARKHAAAEAREKADNMTAAVGISHNDVPDRRTANGGCRHSSPSARQPASSTAAVRPSTTTAATAAAPGAPSHHPMVASARTPEKANVTTAPTSSIVASARLSFS